MKKILFLLALTGIAPALYPAEITIFRPGGSLGIFETGKAPEFHIRLAAGETEADGTFTVKDYSGRTIHTRTLKLKTNTDQTITLPSPGRNGFFTVGAAFPGTNAEASFVAVSPQEKRDPFFSIRPFDWSEPEMFNACRMLGFGALQVSCGSANFWFSDNFSPEKAREAMLKSPYFTRVKKLLTTNPDFTYYGQIGLDPYLISNQKRRKIPEAITTRRDQGYYCYPKEYYDCLALHTETFQKIAGNRIRYWSLGQEIDAAIHDRNRVSHGGPVELANHLVSAGIAYNALKKNDPDCLVALMSSCGRDYHITKPPFLLTKFILNHLNGKFDIIGLDAYNGNYSLRGGRTRVEPPENGLRQHILDARSLSREFGKDGTVSVDERSFHMPEAEKKTLLNGPLTRMLADYTARENIIIKSVSSVPFFCYLDYAYKNDQVMWKALFDHRNRLHRTPYPAAVAYATTARMLAFARPAKKSEIKLSYSVYGYLFSRNGKTILPLWHADEKGGTIRYEIDLPADCVLTDIEGNDSILKKGRQILQITGTPFFLTLPLKTSEVRMLIEKGRFCNMTPVRGTLRPADDGQANLFLVNLLSEPLEVIFQNRKFKLKGYEKRVFTVPRPAGKRNSIQAGNESIPLSFASEVLAVPKMNGKIAVDGNLAKYKEIKPIVLDSPKDIYPREATIPERALILNDGRDIRVELYAAWNRENLYLAAKVRDRSHRNNHDAENLWRGDSMQIGIVPGNLAWPVELNPDAKIPFNMSAALTDKGIFVYDHAAKRSRQWPCSISRSGLYTTYELAVPWKAIGIASPHEGSVIAMNAVFFDLNTPGGSVQHWAALSEGLAGKTDPGAFQTFQLGKEPSCGK